MFGITILNSARLCAKNAGGGLMCEGGHICGTLQF